MVFYYTFTAMHAVIDRQKNHGIHFRVLAKIYVCQVVITYTLVLL
jgi:ribulose 1,5-bisphosphate carboxylase large subunit-like protein